METSRESSNRANKIAKDVFTIPNAITLTGGILAWRGAEELNNPCGLSKAALGRLLDIIDGPVSRLTVQTSDVGAALDAITDKIVMAKILHKLHEEEIVPEEFLVSIATSNLANAIATGIANLRSDKKAETRPTKSGKLAMAGETVTLISYIAAHIAEQDKNPKLAKLLRKLGAAAFAASLPFAAHATCTYIKRAVKGNAEKEKPRQISDVKRTLGSMAMLRHLSGRS
jgi:phosphatidylglycerophosphate synthase